MDFQQLYKKVAIKATPEYVQLKAEAVAKLQKMEELYDELQEKIVFDKIQEAYDKKLPFVWFDCEINDKLRTKLIDAGFKINGFISGNRTETIVSFSEYLDRHDPELRRLLSKLVCLGESYKIRDELISGGMDLLN